jgi:molecular chaperone HtpG
MEQHSWKIQLEGLLKLIAGPLYKDREVFVRELVQNAHDSIRKRVHAEGLHVAPEIRWIADPQAGTLTIRDNGAGLTREEVHLYLSTVGRSGTGELKEALHSSDFIGQHGIGFLSAFAVADRVEVRTRSAAGPGLRWISSGGNDYGLEEIVREERGTDVTLWLNREQRRFLSYTLLASTVRRYADIIGLPVYIGDSLAPANRVDAPWRHAAVDDEAHRELFRSRFGEDRPLVLWPVDLPYLYLDERTQSPREGRVRGMLAVSERALPGFNTGAAVEVFSGMMVANRAPEVLPAWATFILGILECDQLQPNAARDGLVAGDGLSSLRGALGAFLVEKLSELGDQDPERLEDVLRWHSYEILGMSLQNGNESFFEAIAPVMPLETMTGLRVTLQGLWEAAGGKPVLLRYRTVRTSEPGPSGFASGAGADEIVDASRAFVEEFLRCAARRWPARVRIECVEDSGEEDRLEELSPRESALFEPALAVFREIAGLVTVRLARLEDEGIPAVLALSGSSSERELRLLADDVRVPAGLRRAVRSFASSRQEARVLWLNAGNGSVNAINSADPGRPRRTAAALLFHVAGLTGSANLSRDELRRISGDVAEAIRLLLGEVCHE